MAQLPILAITAGDPAGAGPEITARAFANDSVYEMCRPVVPVYSATPFSNDTLLF